MRRCATGSTASWRTSRAADASPPAQRLAALIDGIAPAAERLGAGELLPFAYALAERNGAIRQREVAAARGVRGLVAWQAERYGDPLPAAPAG